MIKVIAEKAACRPMWAARRFGLPENQSDFPAKGSQFQTFGN